MGGRKQTYDTRGQWWLFIILLKCLLSFVTWMFRVENCLWLFMAECHVVWHANRTSAPQNVNLIFTRPPRHSFGLVRITVVGTCLAVASLTASLYMITRYGKSIENALLTTSTPDRESTSSMALPDGMSAIESMSASFAPVPIMRSSCGTCSFVRQRKSWSTSIPITLSTMPAHSLQTATPLG